jgi:AbrB family looped-hinge helix DNA binding protein
MRSRVSVRGQTVIPAEVRRKFGITSRDTLDWAIQDGDVVVRKIPADPLRASLGILKGKGTVEEFLADRAEERRKERVLEGVE